MPNASGMALQVTSKTMYLGSASTQPATPVSVITRSQAQLLFSPVTRSTVARSTRVTTGKFSSGPKCRRTPSTIVVARGGSAVTAGMAVARRVAVGRGVAVARGVAVSVARGVAVARSVGVGGVVAVGRGVGVSDGVAVGSGVAVTRGVAVGSGGIVAMSVGVEAVLATGVAVAVGQRVGEGSGVCACRGSAHNATHAVSAGPIRRSTSLWGRWTIRILLA